MTPRPYQSEAIERIFREFDAGKKCTLAVMPTGTGKTVVAGHVIKRFLESDNRRTMALAHRGELLEQARRSIQRICGGLAPDLEKAQSRAGESWYCNPRMVAASIQTLIAGRNGKRRIEKFDPHDFSFVWFDEIHHGPSDSWRLVLKHFQKNPNIKILGVTATPDRLDGATLGMIADSVAYEMTMLNAVEEAWLVPIKQRIVRVHGLDFSKCKTTAGDLNGGDLARCMEAETPLHKVAASAHELCQGKTLVFCVSVAQAIKLTEIINRYRPESARYIHGKTLEDERKTTLMDFTSGRFDFLCNVGVLTEGYDEPGVVNIVQARPTKSRALYQQMVGRGTRTLEGTIDGIESAQERSAAIAASAKPHCTVIDYTGNSGKHKLITSFDILGGDYTEDEIELAARAADEGEQDVREALAKARAAAKAKAEARQKQIEAERAAWQQRANVRAESVNYTVREIDPFNVLDLERVTDDPGGFVPASEKVYAALERFKVDNPRRLPKKRAEYLLRTLFARSKAKLCTSMKMLNRFKRMGLPTNVTWTTAHEWMDKIVKSGWQMPDELRQFTKRDAV